MPARVSLRPTARRPRRVHDFSAGWRFHLGELRDPEHPRFDDAAWEPVCLPHSTNCEDTFTPSRGYYRGAAWYRKRFRLRGQAPGRRLYLVLEGAFAVTRVWLNGREVGYSVDGYTGMALDLTAALLPGENVLAVRVDNSHDPDVLPGRPEPDYNLYGGLYREAALVATGDPCVPRSGLRLLTPVVSAQAAQVQARLQVSSGRAGALRVAAAILDPAGRPAARAQAEAALSPGENTVLVSFPPLPRPRLWSPDTPHLYRAVCDLYCDGLLTDRAETTFGLRWFEFTEQDGFLLNGRRLLLLGVNRHQDYPGLAHALPSRLQRSDAELIKALGGNFVRASHYPQHPAFLAACDDLGICVYEEIASWQFIGGPRFADNAEAMMRAMVRRDANHPSLILWGLFNEGRDPALFARLHQAAHQEDPSRPTVYAENSPEQGLPLGTVWIPDVLGLNYELDRLDDLRRQLAGRKLLSSEHTNAGTPDPADPDQCRAQADRINADLDHLGARAWLAGSALWSMHDYGTDYHLSWPVQHSGVLDAQRRPKESAYLLCARWRQDPFVHIAGHWNPTPEPVRQVRVYTNCPRLHLLLDGRDLGERPGGHIRTWEVPYAPGCLEAVGSREGVEVRYALRTHGQPARLVLEANAPSLTHPGDACWLSACLYDGAGAPVLTGRHQVHFSASGPLRLRGVGGKTVDEAIRGVACLAVARTEGQGEAVVQAHLGRLCSPPLCL